MVGRGREVTVEENRLRGEDFIPGEVGLEGFELYGKIKGVERMGEPFLISMGFLRNSSKGKTKSIRKSICSGATDAREHLLTREGDRKPGSLVIILRECLCPRASNSGKGIKLE